MLGRNTIITLVAILVASLATPALAKREKRTGFNFGTSVRMLTSDDRTYAMTDENSDTRIETNSQALMPYLGYSIGALNLGLTFSVENKDIKSVETSKDGLTTNSYNTSISSKGSSIFARFLFGRVFFFEAAAGIYKEKVETTSEYLTNDGSGEIAGHSNQDKVEGVGVGYHFAGGMEIAMGGGFYFTSSYLVRIVQLRDYDGDTDFGQKRAREQKREILFGLAHYYR